MIRLPLRWRFRAAVACLIIPPLINTISFARVVKRLTRNRPNRAVLPFDDEDMANWVTNFLHRLPDPWYPTCLRRAAVLYYLLNRAGLSVQMYLGVQRPASDEIDAHAWLVLTNKPYLEPATTDPSQYKVIARFPEGSSAENAERDTSLEPTEV